jgi:diguanylate cyclase (GGDEF)-like protein
MGREVALGLFVMSAVRRALRNRAVTYALAGLAAFAMAFIWYLSHARTSEAKDDRLVRTVREQIARSHEVTAHGLLVVGGHGTVAELQDSLTALTTTQAALRIGDDELNVSAPSTLELETLFAVADASLDRLSAAAEALGRFPTASAGAELADAASSSRSDMLPIADTYAGRAAATAVRTVQAEIVGIAIGFSLALGIAMLMGRYTRRRRAILAAVATARDRQRTGQIDSLTGLPKRAAFRDRLVQAVHAAVSGDGVRGLLLVGVDRAPATPLATNDPHRDSILRHVAGSLRDVVRATDLVARSGRDQFAVLVDIRRREDAAVVAEKILEALADTAGASGITPVVSVGIAVAPFDAERADELMRMAGGALAHVRRSGGRNFGYYSTQSGDDAEGALRVIERLQRAVRTGDGLWLAYQPKVRVEDGEVVGYEALARWTDRELGKMLPDDFIPIAEQSDLIIELGAWVIDETCRQLATWRSAGRPSLPIAVNISPRQIRHGGLQAAVEEALERHRVEATLLELEITEAVLLADDDRPLSRVRSLRSLGVRVAVDDFGTGYASLGYLKRFPVDGIKIDRSFVQGLGPGTSDRAIAAAIVALGHSLGLEVVAEGVETEEHLSVLRDLGCDTAQGFLFGEPLPATAAVRAGYRKHRTPPPRSLSFGTA